MTKSSSFLLSFALYSTVISVQAAQFKIGEHTFTLPDGFTIEQVADPKLVDRPINGTFDEQGRLYVSDSSGSNEKLQDQLEKKPHRIVRLEDTDGDGKFDKSAVFADKMMFPEGTLWFNGSLYVSAVPSIWKLTDTDGDGVADKREEWFQGKTLTGCGNDLHGPYAGPDGWIYWCKGAFAEQTHDVHGQPFTSRAGHVFRSREDLSGFEPVMTGGMDNPVEVAFSRGGERFLSCTFFQFPEGGHRDGLIHIIYGGIYGKDHSVLDGHKRTGELMPVLTHLGPAAASGLLRYDSAVLGKAYQGNLFTCCFNLHKVVRSILVPDNASFRTIDSDFLVSDNVDFHPTDVLEDADGSLIVIDTGGWYKLCCPTSQFAKPDVLGAIYRIRRANAPKMEDPHGQKIKWDEIPADQLTKYLGEERTAVRERAMKQLARLGEKSVGSLKEVLSGGSVEARLNAVWTLTRIETSSASEAIRSALNDKDETVLHAAIHSVSLHRDAGAFGRLIEILKSSPPALQRVAAEALGRLGKPDAIPVLLAAAAKDQGRVLEHSLIYALIEIADPGLTAADLSSPNSRTKRAALIALDQMMPGMLEGKQLIGYLLSNDKVLKETAHWLIQHHPNWSGELSGFLQAYLFGVPKLGETQRADLRRQMADLATDAYMQDFMVKMMSLTNLSNSAREIIIQAMAQSKVGETPGIWANALQSCITNADKGVQSASITTVRTLPLPSDREIYTGALLSVARDTNASSDLRINALSAIHGTIKKPEPEVWQFLLSQMESSQPPLQRSAAAGIISRTQLNEDQMAALTDAIKAVGPMEVSKLVGAFQQSTNESVGLKLVAALKESKGQSGLRVDTTRELLSKYPESVRKAGDELVKMLNADWEKQKAHLDEIQTALPSGDYRRGQQVFSSQKVGCMLCHAVGYNGGKVGPDLTRIGTIRTERDLLEAIVYPSASFVRSFEPMRILTKDGEDYSGIIKDETTESVHLVSSPTSEQHISRANIAEIRPGNLSVMPEGLDQQMTKEELADLIAYLKSLGTK